MNKPPPWKKTKTQNCQKGKSSQQKPTRLPDRRRRTYREIARNAASELTIYGRDGKIQERFSSNVEYPSLSDRFQSTFIDMLFVIAMMFISSSILEPYEQVPDWVTLVLFLGLGGIYEPLSTSLRATIGNSVKNIRVKKITNTNKKINLVQAFLRYILKISLGWISFISIHFNPEKEQSMILR